MKEVCDSSSEKEVDEIICTLCDNCGTEMPKICGITCPKCGHKHDCGEH